MDSSTGNVINQCGKDWDYRIISTSCDEIYGYVLLLVVKGNLRHRIEKLGTEKDEAELNNPQIKLRRIAEQQTQPWWIVEKVYERPQWANGAFVYLSQGHARVIENAIRVSGKVLQSKHLLVSPQFKPLVKEVLEASPEGPGREAFLMRRAGVIDGEETNSSAEGVAGRRYRMLQLYVYDSPVESNIPFRCIYCLWRRSRLWPPQKKTSAYCSWIQA